MAIALLVAACASPQVQPDPVAPTKWSTAVQAEIDAAVARKDCNALQLTFDRADTNGNTDLMAYVDKRMREAGCYS